jgi:hypothetical protein
MLTVMILSVSIHWTCVGLDNPPTTGVRLWLRRAQLRYFAPRGADVPGSKE